MTPLGVRVAHMASWAITLALAGAPLAASLCGGEPPDQNAMECCRKDMAHCNMPGKMESCCHPDGGHQTRDASGPLAIAAKQKSKTDSAVLPGTAPLAVSIVQPYGTTSLPEISQPLPRHPLIKPLRI